MKKLNKYILLTFITALVATFFVSVQTANADMCSELARSTGGFFSCGGEEATSFTQFQGGLQPPSSEGYDPTLTQQTNLRDFIVNAVNFVLGFLGLVAVIMVIYGGFLYVIAGGAEEQTTKGKKSVMYAVIGIVIILVSFALVNTVIKGVGKGTDAGVDAPTTLPGSAPSELTGDQTQSIRRLFFAAANQVEKAAKDLATNYAHYVDVNDALGDLESVPYVDRAEQLHVFLSDIKRALQSIDAAAGDLSRTSEATKNAEDYVDIFLRQSQQQLTDDWTFWWVDESAQLQLNIDSYLTQSGAEGESIWRANLLDFADKIEGIIDDLEDLKTLINESGLVTTAETDFGVAYERAVDALELLIPTAFDIPTNKKVVDALEALNELHQVVQNIKFVATVITADIAIGNAPLIVNVDALKSIRPDFQSINEADIEWDFGDGTTVEGKFATSHVYKKVGSYIIKLSIKGDSANAIASGVAYQEITIKPPASQINLQITVGDRYLGYMSYYKDAFLVIDKNRLNVTLTEARDIGIIFDASETRGGFQSEQTQEAGETYIQTIGWEFGDGSDRIYGEMVAQDVQTHYYGEEGTYPVIIEVEDSRGVKDRKVFEVVVDSPAARVDILPKNVARINEDITFDASNSSSDGGQITGYNWQLNNSQLRYSAEETEQSFTKSFESPGIYSVNLRITDNLGNVATDSSIVTIESQPPEAKFTYSTPDESKPHIYYFDGSQSFDPDGNIQTGEYIYKWKVHAIDDDYDFINSETGEVDSDSADKDRMYLKFYRTGDYKVSLQVDDINEPENPGIAHEQIMSVDSILDVAFGNVEQAAGILDSDSETTIDFLGFSENAVAYEWDFGDGTDKVSGDMVGKRTDVKHIYTAAGSYDVRLTVFDREDNENSIKRRIVIGNADSPLAVISVKLDRNEIYDFTEPIEVNRKSVLEFNAERSLNVDGTGRRLGYQWDFGDTQRSTEKAANHTYSDLSPTEPGHYSASLKVFDKDDLTKTSIANVNINVIGELPTMQAFTAIPQQSDLTTPVRVKLEAIGAKDPDGQIVKYLWWYYNEKDPSVSMGHTITQNPQAVVTLGTRGAEGDPVNYKFGLQMTDQENFTISVEEILNENVLPIVTVINGPNDIPVANFNVDRSSVMAGDVVNFTSSSYDPDGRIISYIWDFEGDGFGNNEEVTKSTIAHTYTELNEEGINVRLKVIDDNFAESISLPVKIYVDVHVGVPIADFDFVQIGPNKVGFINNSVADAAAGSILDTFKWDFDLSSSLESADSDGDGILENDLDSQERNPIWNYEQPGIYRVRLTVVDNYNNEAEVVKFVNVKESGDVVISDLKADFVSDPPVNPEDGAIHLQGSFDEVRFDFSNSTGFIQKYVFDNNVYVDSNNNGRKADDEDYVTSSAGVYTTTFNPEAEKIKVRLTVYGEENAIDLKEVNVIFDSDIDDLGANLLGSMNGQIPSILVSIFLFGIISLSLYKLSLNE
jgi:PKD repeat protein